MIEPIKTVEMHTGGEPLRIITSGIPLPGTGTLLDKRRYLKENADQYRRFLMFEPRGHKDMYGALLVPADHPDANFGVIFMHNEGYSTMCGHAVIALGRFAVDSGLVHADGRHHVPIKIQCPCGLVSAEVDVTDGHSGAVRFESVPAFAYKLDQFVDTAEFGPVELDIAYGGAFYGILEAATVGLDLDTSPVQSLVNAANQIAAAIRAQVKITHPEEEDLGFLYGIIFTDGHIGADGNASRNVCIFADGQVDRSPTGSGVTARMALAAARGNAEIGEQFTFESLTDSIFSGKIVTTGRLEGFDAVTVEVSGRAHYSGTAEFTMEDDDMLAGGFLLR
ncbi:proline racemase [Alphaproteobacteria bacterium 46_93_T64]|nr:proline racemase [Alphaproteobacteria bacterium 46_93_T64]